MHGLRIRERLQKQYASDEAGQGASLEQLQTPAPTQRREVWLDTDENEVGSSTKSR